jgi:metallo-beta-lactamase family protein
VKLQFLGANRQVTGSCYLLEAGGLRILVDCGMFQERPFQERNWAPWAVAPGRIDAMLLTHAHLDHSGLVPRLVRDGYGRRIYTTAASVELTRLVLEDSARIQEEDLAFKQQRHAQEGRKGPHPSTPLYSVADTEAALKLLSPVPYGQALQLNDRVTVTYHDAGHILGSASLEVAVRSGGKTRGSVRTVLFSGDVGMFDKPLIRAPELPRQADYLVMESTYGDSDHDRSTPVEEQLAKVVNETVQRGGNVVVPTFAIERAQELLYYLSRLLAAGRIPNLMVFLDSPMAVNATAVFERHRECLTPEAVAALGGPDSPLNFPGLVLAKTVAQSKAINHLRGSCVILAGAGMCTGGRIKHHLIENLAGPKSTVLFVGYQSQGTLGREIEGGAAQVRVLGRELAVKAQVRTIRGLSAHADRSALLRWAGALAEKPRQLFLTHGEEKVALSLAETIRTQLKWAVTVPEYRQTVSLD